MAYPSAAASSSITGEPPLLRAPALVTESRGVYAVFFASEMPLALVVALALTCYARSLSEATRPLPAVVFALVPLLHPVAVTRYDAVVRYHCQQSLRP
ncbi:MAG: hypothetical protein M3305_07835 [Actinomycetota bacterium]|nr:hypothetical protein [Actinomycetota bacterium]